MCKGNTRKGPLETKQVCLIAHGQLQASPPVILGMCSIFLAFVAVGHFSCVISFTRHNDSINIFIL